ncbi:MAG: lysophospholipid acyltransferase family protein [Eubacteriales bacterium]|nr:lysophospholipid acyltransferase family protein [Eubacteriales bacterium]MDD4421945.1 lysophospholipid acyltransferase family protein [Eubacteriales bacterium]
MFYRALKILLIPFFKLLYRIKVVGRENEPSENYIACANHSSYIDPVLIAYALKHTQRFVARSSLVRFGFYRWLFRRVKVITINRGSTDISSIRTITQAVSDGDCVSIFPQGTRIKGVIPRPEQAQGGIGLLAVKTNALILPVSIITKRLRPRLFKKTVIVIGKAIPASEYLNCCENSRSKDIAVFLFSRVCIPFEGMKSEKSDVEHG